MSSSEAEGGLTGDKLKELTHQATDLIYGGEDLGPDSVRLSVQRSQNDVCRIANVLERGEYDFDGTIEERVSQLGLCLVSSWSVLLFNVTG